MSTIKLSQFSDDEGDAVLKKTGQTKTDDNDSDYDQDVDADADADARSISLSSPPHSPKKPTVNENEEDDRVGVPLKRTSTNDSHASASLLAAAGLHEPESEPEPEPASPPAAANSSPHLALFAAAGLEDAVKPRLYSSTLPGASNRDSIAAVSDDEEDEHDDDDDDDDADAQRHVLSLAAFTPSPGLSPRQSFAHEDHDSDDAPEISIPLSPRVDNAPEQHPVRLDSPTDAPAPAAAFEGHRISLSSSSHGSSPRNNFATLDHSDTASARSIILDSPSHSRHSSELLATVSPSDSPKAKLSKRGMGMAEYAEMIAREHSAPAEDYEDGVNAYPPRALDLGRELSRQSMFSTASGSSYSKKARPESMLTGPKGPLVLGIALVDFNHLVGPKIEFHQGSVFEDEEVQSSLPFLALPDGAHLSSEDYSYFHIVPNSPNPSTVFGISCNRQIRSADLLVKDADVTRSTVQKAVVVLASIPVFGLIRDRLGVVTRALFDQRDFTNKDVLIDFHESLEIGLRSQLTESGLYMGTSLRQLVHTFRHRTLVLVKALILQKRIMFSGYPVERLCTQQYSLVSLIPGLLQALEDCGSPPLATRAPSLSQPASLKTSDRRSMMAYAGLPLDIFGKDAFFQPYIPLQQLDMMKETRSWLCGSTNSIVSQSPEVDLLVDLETGTFEFRNPLVERATGLTAADRKWVDEIVQDVNDGWTDEEPERFQFKGSDDYIRVKFDEYISAALASVKYADFMNKGEAQGVMITDGPSSSSVEDFNPLWVAEFKRTNAYEVWNRITDPVLFDLVDPRHPCGEKPSVVSDISLRLSEGIQELKLDQQLAPAREAVSSAITAGSTTFFKAVEGVRGRWAQRQSASAQSLETLPAASNSQSGSSTPVDLSRSEIEGAAPGAADQPNTTGPAPTRALRPLSLVANKVPEAKPPAPAAGWGIGSFLSSRWSAPRTTPPQPPTAGSTTASPTPPATVPTRVSEDEIPEEWKPRNLDEEHPRKDLK